VNPLTSALTRWAEMLANESAQLDPLTQKRLRGLDGHSIAIEFDPSGETTTLQFDGDSIRVATGHIDAPSVIIRGAPSALAAAFVGARVRTGGGITIEGDEVVLSQFRGIVRDYRPDFFEPLESLVGIRAAQAITSLFEVGFSALSAIGRSVAGEGERLARTGVRQRYLTSPELESFLESIQALRVRIDRLNVRTNVIEQARSGEISDE